MKKLFLFFRDGKIFYGSSLEDATAVEVKTGISHEFSRRFLTHNGISAGEGSEQEVNERMDKLSKTELFLVPPGWRVEYEYQFYGTVSDTPAWRYCSEKDYAGYKLLCETRKIARLIPLKSQSSGIAAIGVPEYGEIDNATWNAMGQEGKSPVIPEGSEKRFNYFHNHGDEDGNNSLTICFGDSDEPDHIIVTCEDTEEDAIECVKRLNDILFRADKPAIDDTLKGSESGWISTKDRIPDHHNLVNICMTSGAITVGRMARTNRWSIFTVTGTDIESQTNRVEYWQSLPKSPKP